MNNSQKTEIQTLLESYVSRFPSQKKASQSMKDVSEATLINIKKGNWGSVSEEMWNKVAKIVGYSTLGTWSIADTQNLLTLKALFDDARDYHNTLAIQAPAGAGKTRAAKWYTSRHENVIHIECNEFMNRKAFLSDLLEKMGLDNSGSVSYMMQTIRKQAAKFDSMLIILDEVDKLNDQVLYFFITLYNLLSDGCGFALMSTDFFQKRIERGLAINKKGYQEIFSRIGRRFINLKEPQLDDVRLVCNNNGIMSEDEVMKIYNESDGDLRRVERMIHKYKRLNGGKNGSKPA